MNHLSKPSGLHLTHREIQSIPLTTHNAVYNDALFNNLLKKQASSVKGRCTRKYKSSTKNTTKKNK